MLVEKTSPFKFSTLVENINRVIPTFDNSILLKSDGIWDSTILHFDSTGKELFRYETDYLQGNVICLLDDRNIAVAESSLNRITLINL
jgi:hypothetical protein